MRRLLEAISNATSVASAVLLLAIMLAGCGSTGSASPGISSSAASVKKGGVISLTSTAITGSEIPARYTCDGADISPPLKWGEVPSGTKELVLFALSPIPGGSGRNSSIEWAMAGLKPELHKLTAGQLPSGAFLEQDSDGQRHYSICPPKGQTKRYEFVLYAVPPLVRVGRRINGLTLLENLSKGIPSDLADGEGTLFATYRRR